MIPVCIFPQIKETPNPKKMTPFGVVPIKSQEELRGPQGCAQPCALGKFPSGRTIA
jgi:hypothetical protein